MNYFAPPPTLVEQTLRRTKGNFRRDMILDGVRQGGFDWVPESWTKHDLSEPLKAFLQMQDPRARGGEDLPDLEEGEVEIARLTLADSVHGEVTSLRAQQDSTSCDILLRMVDEYGTEFVLPADRASEALSAGEVLQVFREADPSPVDTDCQIEFQSFFYKDIDELAQQKGN